MKENFYNHSQFHAHELYFSNTLNIKRSNAFNLSLIISYLSAHPHFHHITCIPTILSPQKFKYVGYQKYKKWPQSPHSQQMGWSEFTPFFCIAAEIARDIIQYYTDAKINLLQHYLEHHLYSNSNFAEYTPSSTPKISMTNVYIDGFIAATKHKSKHNILLQTSRDFLFGIHSIFLPPYLTQHNGGDSISVKELCKMEGAWDTKN